MKLTRRHLIKATASAGLAAGFSPIAPVFAQAPLNSVTIPASGQQVPGIGIGCRNYRANPNSAELPVFRDTIATYHRLGGKIVDTSPNYGNSEEVIGNIMGELGIRDDLWIATKVDRENRQGGIERMERSFELLGGDSFELMQVHNLRGTEVQLETMRAWQEQGRFRYIGVTTSSDRQYNTIVEIIENNTLQFIQVDYSLGNRNVADRILPLAVDKGIAVLVNLPFGRGRLFNAVGDRSLPDWASDIDATSWAQVFLKYVMSYPGTVIPIPGTTKPHHAEDNVAAARGRLPDADLRREMERFIDPLLA
ncbi:MAG: aldo/keto reductase [Gammaproteobacteria bacterium]|jgi:aryl-alcohol dehydrogenase-like predicted oxidoreductase|nr:aldo/keto reductase [Gammaproteobacteria bacterium]MDP7455118.1 aldo/keto reductase [Gammaproteobacteria bacterium]